MVGDEAEAGRISHITKYYKLMFSIDGGRFPAPFAPDFDYTSPKTRQLYREYHLCYSLGQLDDRKSTGSVICSFPAAIS